MFRGLAQQKIRSKRGAALTEYCFVLAFVSVLIAFAFNFTQGSLFSGVSNSFSSCTSQLDRLNTASLAPPQ